MNKTTLFDQYSFRARLQPALLTLLPAAIAIFAWTGPGVKWQSALWTLFGTAGGTYFLAVLARNFGKRIEPGLWESWGGAPTTQLLRHSGPANPVMRERWHKNLSKLLGKPFPTVAEETANPTEADNIYNAAVKLQILKTRDTKKYHLLFKENIQYGFCRNLYAMKVRIPTQIGQSFRFNPDSIPIHFGHCSDLIRTGFRRLSGQFSGTVGMLSEMVCSGVRIAPE